MELVMIALGNLLLLLLFHEPEEGTAVLDLLRVVGVVFMGHHVLHLEILN